MLSDTGKEMLLEDDALLLVESTRDDRRATPPMPPSDPTAHRPPLPSIFYWVPSFVCEQEKSFYNSEDFHSHPNEILLGNFQNFILNQHFFLPENVNLQAFSSSHPIRCSQPHLLHWLGFPSQPLLQSNPPGQVGTSLAFCFISRWGGDRPAFRSCNSSPT